MLRVNWQVTNQFQIGEVLKNIQLRLQKLQDLAQHVADRVDLIHERLDKFDDILANINNAHAKSKVAVMTKQKLPTKPFIFHGRDDLVQEISELLCQEKSCRVCILGPGGMGKTSLALTVIHSSVVQARYPSLQCFWVPCVEASSSTPFLELLSISLRIDPHVEDILEAVVSELKTTNEPRLIVLDNFETVWYMSADTQKEHRKILLDLGKLPHVAILMTMRGAEPPCNDIQWQSRQLRPVDRDASLRIFHDWYPTLKNDPDVEKLIDAMGHMPFAVTLMSKLGKKSSSTAEDLLKEWAKAGTKMLSPSNSAEDNLDRSIILSLDRDFVRQDPDSLELLAILSLLPAGTSRTNLRWLAPHVRSISNAISTLLDAALLLDDRGESIESTRLFVLPVIQSFMSSTGRISDRVLQQVKQAYHRYILDHAYRYYDPAFKTHKGALEEEDTNIQSILIGSELTSGDPSISSDQEVEVLLRFAWHRFDTRPSMVVAQRTVEVARLSGKKKFIAEALTVLGGTCHRISKFGDAERYSSEAFQLFDGLTTDGDIPKLAIECGLLLARSRAFLDQPGGENISFIRALQSKYEANLDDFGRASILKELGRTLSYEDEYEEALDVLGRAKDIFTELDHPFGVAETLLNMSKIYRWLNQPDKALKAIVVASHAIESVNVINLLHAGIYLHYGLVLASLCQETESLAKLQTSLSSYRYIGDILGDAQCLESMGYVYMKREYHQDSVAAYEAALEKYSELGDRPYRQDGIDRCRTNLSIVARKEEDGQEVMKPPF